VTNPTLQTLLNTGNSFTLVTGANLNALASGTAVLSAAFSNVIADSAGLGFPRARLKFHSDSLVVSAGGSVYGWFLTAADGSIYEQGSASVIPVRPVDFSFPAVAQTAAVDLEQLVPMPTCATIKCLIYNNLGAALASNTNGYLKAYYETDTFPNL
jgi:hypothetical protein